jgi:hypothetical protein
MWQVRSRRMSARRSSRMRRRPDLGWVLRIESRRVVR